MKTLFTISAEMDSAARVESFIDNDDELFVLCQALASFLLKNRIAAAGLEAIMELIKEKKELYEQLVTETVEIPDFNAILKNLN